MEWEFMNESPRGFPSSGGKTGMLSCRGHPLGRPWTSHDLTVSHHHVNSVIAILVERNKPVSSLPSHPVHLFPSHTDSDAEITFWPEKLIELLHRSNRDCGTEDLTRRTQQAPGFTPILARPTAAPAKLISPLGSWPQTVPNIAKFSPISLKNMHFHAGLCALFLGVATASSAGLVHQIVALGSLTGSLSVAATDHFTLRNGYGTVEARYHLTAYDCSDPSEVQA